MRDAKTVDCNYDDEIDDFSLVLESEKGKLDVSEDKQEADAEEEQAWYMDYNHQISSLFAKYQ